MRLNRPVCVGLLAVSAVLVAGAEQKEDLERDMKAMNKPYKGLLKQIKDKTKNADSLKLLIDLEAATLKAKAGEPDHLPGKTNEEHAKALTDYKSMMATCLIEELNVEQALLEDDNETAAKKLDELTATMESGHKDYRPKRGDH